MKQLFWKEWYELRLLPVAAAVCVALLIFAAKAFNKYYDSQPFRLDETFLPLGATWALFGLMAGAGLIAQEIGSGNLLLLSALPISRGRVWWIKASTALGVFLLSVLSSLLAWAILDAFLLQDGFFHAPLWHQTTRQLWSPTWALLAVSASFFAIGLAVSAFLDRPIGAAVAALLISIAYFAALQSLVSAYETRAFSHYFNGAPPQHDPILPFDVLALLTVLMFATVSYWTFTRGETLRSAKRFRIGAVTGGLSLVAVALVFFMGSQLQVW